MLLVIEFSLIVTQRHSTVTVSQSRIVSEIVKVVEDGQTMYDFLLVRH